MKAYSSPTRIVVTIMAAIFIAEGMIMFLLSTLPELGLWQEALLDSLLIVMVTAPIIYFLIYQPLINQIEEINKKQKELDRNLHYDALTELPNRLFLEERLNQLLERNEPAERVISLILLDLGRFNEINDTLGHRHGDEILKQLARRFEVALTQFDTVARTESDEFAFILISSAVEHVTLGFEHIQCCLDEPFEIENVPINVDTRTGIAIYPDHGRNSAELLRNADIALRSSKREKRHYSIYCAEKNPYNVKKLALFGQLRRAIEQNQLELFYQPKISLNSSKVVAAEALIRWRHPEQGLIPPLEFIPLAEKSTLITPLTHWVVDRACAQIEIWRRRGIEIKVAVNISPCLLSDHAFLDWVHEALKKHSTPKQALIFEITESSFSTNYQRTLEILQTFTRMGVILSIDDFGTGYSSLSYLSSLPVTELKIDQCFVKAMTASDSDYAIVCSTIELAHNLGLSVTAEGVETESSANLLYDLHCDCVQGYFYSRPLPCREFENWYKNYHFRPPVQLTELEY